jgi:hypothetical protein
MDSRNTQFEQLEREIFELADACLRSEITADEVARLETLLRETSTARQIYSRYIQDSFRLRNWAVAQQKLPAFSSLELAPAFPESDVDLTTTSVGDAAASKGGNYARGVSIAVVVLLLTYFTGLAFYVSLRNKPGAIHLAQHKDNPAAATIFATLVGTLNCQWDGIAPAELEGPLTNSVIKLRSGAVELNFAQGANVTIEGPATFELRSANGGFLKVGKLVAHVPPQAVGFTIDTPTVQIVDLGTEFGVETNDNGATEVQVFQGATELRPLKSGKAVPLASPIKISAGAARRIEPGDKNAEPTVREIAATPERFTRQIANRGNRRIKVEGAMASSTEYPARPVENLINDSGMTGDRHTNAISGGMWHSAFGKLENEFVLFDLGRPYRLSSMKVWNFNEAAQSYYRRMGAKHVDIYVSLSGKWDPIKEPAAWTKLHDHYRLSCASGTDDYDTPDVVPLSNVQAKFVAIVFHDRLKELPKIGHEPETVGLSEVRLFGERVELPKVNHTPANAR